jgi:hypothetical protein
MMTAKKQADGYFGLCPHCRNTDGYINISKSHWFICAEHKMIWRVGINLFSSWKDQTEDEQRWIYSELGIGDFAEVEPYIPPGLEGDGPVASRYGMPFRVRAHLAHQLPDNTAAVSTI